MSPLSPVKVVRSARAGSTSKRDAVSAPEPLLAAVGAVVLMVPSGPR